MSVALLFPGQGAQYVGMGKVFFDARPSVRRRFEEASDLTGRDLQRLCFDGPEAELIETDNVQPAITLVNLACLEVLREEGIEAAATAGHSLGEYAALCAAGALTFADTMRLVAARGEAMKAAATRHPGGMTAIFGLDVETLAAICEEVRATGSVEVANHNSPSQVALTGELDALKEAGALAKKRGAKLVVPLKVSGAWHSRFMGEAQDRMREALAGCDIAAPRLTVMANVNAEPHADDPSVIRERLVAQLIRPVRWVPSIQALVARGHSVFIEAGPGKVLTGLMKDINKEVKAFQMQDQDTLNKCLAARAELSF